MPENEQPSGAMPAAVKPNGTGDGQGQQPAAVVAVAPAGDAMSLDQALAELERARKALKDTNAESAGRRKRLEELEAAEQARVQAQMSDAEKATAATKKLQDELAAKDQQMASLREQTVRYEVMLKAQEMAIIDLDAAVRLMDMGALEFGADGKPTNVEAVLKTLVKAKPYLVKASDSTPARLGTPPQKQKPPMAQGQGQAERRVMPL